MESKDTLSSAGASHAGQEDTRSQLDSNRRLSTLAERMRIFRTVMYLIAVLLSIGGNLEADFAAQLFQAWYPQISLDQVREYRESQPRAFRLEDLYRPLDLASLTRDRHPRVEFNVDMFPVWVEKISQALQSRGVHFLEAASIDVQRVALNSNLHSALACNRGPHTIDLHEEITDQTETIHILAHEVAHIQAEHCSALPEQLSSYSEFSQGLGLAKLSESHAQLLALEALAQIALTDQDPLIRDQAEAAFFGRTVSVLYGAEQAMKLLLTQSEVGMPGGASADISSGEGVSFTGDYFYYYLPAEYLMALHEEEVSFPVLRRGDLAGPEVIEIELRYTRRLFLEHGLLDASRVR